MTTTEHRPPRPRTTPLELRLYAVAVLAAVYTITWRAIGAHTTAPPPVARVDTVLPAPPPVIALPAGWQLATQPAPAAAPRVPAVSQPARLVRPSTRRVPRVRTRSS